VTGETHEPPELPGDQHRDHQRTLECYGRELAAAWDDPERAARLRFALSRHLADRGLDGPAERELSRAAELTRTFRPALRAARTFAASRGDEAQVDALLATEIEAAPAGLEKAVLLRSQGLRQLDRGDLLDAENSLTAALAHAARDPGSLRAVEHVGRRAGRPDLVKSGLWAQAEVTTDPAWSALLWSQAARVAHHQGDERAAAEATKAALQVATDTVVLLDLEHLAGARQAWADLADVLDAELRQGGLGPAVAAGLEVRLARVLRDRLERPREAIAALGRALTQAPGDAPAALELCRLAAAHEHHAEHAVALERLAACVHDRPTLAAIRCQLGVLRELRLGDEAGALATLERALQADPTHGPSLAALGRLLTRRCDFARLARMHLEEADRVSDPGRRVGLLHRAAEIQADRLADPEAAVALHLRALHLAPGFPPAVAALERLYGDAGRWRDLASVLEAEAGRASDPRRRRLLWEAAGAVSGDLLQDHGRAIDAWRRVLAIEPTSLGAIRALARLYARTQRFGELCELSQRELDLISDTRRKIQILERCGEIAEQSLGDPEAAIEFYRRALALSPGSLPSLRALGRLYRSLARFGDLAAMHRAQIGVLRSSERIERLLHEIAEIAARHLNDPAAAAQALRDIVQRRPGNTAALAALCAVLRRCGAATELCQALEDSAEAAADPTTRALHLMRAAAEREEKLEDFGRAAALRARALSLDPCLDDLDESDGLSDPPRLLERCRAALLGEAEGPRQRLLAEKIGRLCERTQANPREAVTCFELATTGRDPSPHQLRALARLYRELGRATDLARTYARLASATADAAEAASYSLRAAEVLEAHGDASEAAAACAAARSFARLRPYGLLVEERVARRSTDPRLLAQALLARAQGAGPAEHERSCLLAEAAEAWERAGDPAQAESAYRGALAAAPQGALAHAGLLRLLTSNGRFAEGAALCEERSRVVATPTAKVRALRAAAALYAGPLRDASRAAALCRSALALDPADPWAFSFLTEYYGVHQDERALADLLEARLPHARDHAERVLLLRRAITLTLERLDDRRTAARLLVRLLETESQDVRSLVALADLRFADARFDEALALYRRGLPLCERPAERGRVELQIARCLRRRGDPAAALAACNRALESAPDFVAALELCAELALDLGEHRTAALALEGRAGHSLDPDEKIPLLRQLATLCEERLDEIPRAARALEEALALRPLDLACIEALTGVYTRMGDRAALDRHLRGAARLLRRALDRNPIAPEWLEALGRVLDWMGDRDGASTANAVRAFLGQAEAAPTRSAARRLLPPRRLTTERYEAHVVPPELTPAARALCRAAAPILASVVEARSTRLAAEVRDPLPRRHPLRRACDGLAQSFGNADYDLYLTDAEPRAIHTAFVGRPALIMGAAFESVALRNVDVLALGRALCLIAEGGAIALEATTDHVVLALAAAVRAVRPGALALIPPGLEKSLRRETERVAEVAARPLKRDLKKVAEFWVPGTFADLVTLVNRLAVLGQRAGLLACGDIRLALADVSAEVAAPAADALALIRFALSEEHGSLRRELGWAT
jgi:tetratricopeptide (TPR) repeat protein